jgi:hydroxymethylpyrimidine/phosphomethylpyrimidine kinase
VGIEIVMAAKKGMGALSRRSIRGQILDLFKQARRLSPPNFPETIELSDTSDGR